MKQPIAITANAHGPGLHRVEVGGHDISNGVSKATLWLRPGELPEVDLELAFFETQCIESAEAEVVISDATRDALVKLGWTPPPADA